MTENLLPIKTALFTVTNKTGVNGFARSLREVNPSCEIIASGGTAQTLAENTIPFTPLSEYTGFPECFDGRVKTLHPKIAGGILMRRGVDDAMANELGIQPIDLVVCNLYDFAQACSHADRNISELMESMDIGGSTLIRGACKNYASVTIVVDPNDYPFVLHELQQNKGKLSLATRKRLAVKGINASADYEALLAKVLTKRLTNEETQRPRLSHGHQLPYGENPNQQAWVYHFEDQEGIAKAKILTDKPLSYNNYEDATVAYHAAQELLELNAKHGAAIIKHGSLCAYATGQTLSQAFQLAWEGDSKSAYGSVIAFTSSITEELMQEIKNKFVEVLIAPEYETSFVNWAKKAKPRLRLVQVPNLCKNPFQYKNISGGMLVQTRKEKILSTSMEDLFTFKSDGQEKRIGIVSKQAPNPDQKGLFAFGIAAVNFAKSNAVAIVREPSPGNYQLIGMGAGQPNRVDSLQRLAIPKAIENLQEEHGYDPLYDPKTDLEKCILASDGFFPFDDSIRYAAKLGLKNCIQPGGSKRDQEVIDAADELAVCMVFTGERYFYH
ncbi:MAG: bifunctional phosphoribosylaminoimidazolecarboxamide formyltransferase/IMP cyclohydrolase [Waddliaceae bacterium]